MQRIKNYIHEQDSRLYFTWDNERILLKLGETRNTQDKLLKKKKILGFDLQNEAVLDILTSDVIKSSETEGEFLGKKQVRSSITRRLGLNIASSVYLERNAERVVEIMSDAINATGNILSKMLYKFEF